MSAIIKAADAIKSVGGAITVGISLVGGGVALTIWVYSLRADTTSNIERISALEKIHETDSNLGEKIDALRAALERKQGAP